METSTLYIKNMVCNRCIRVVGEELEKQGLNIQTIELGKVIMEGELTNEKAIAVEKTLIANGFELITDRQHKIIEQIKTIIIGHIHYQKPKPARLNFSDFLEQQTGINYFNLSKLFSSFEGITIEKYIILQKIERVKELLIYGEKTLSEIAYDMEYSSVAHLSGQFKKVTGLTPTAFKQMTGTRRRPLDQVKD